MNREILFRGQTRRKGEKVRMDGSPVASNWVYGGVLKGIGDHSIIYQTEPEFHKFPVYTDTIGQYTGLTDKNSVKIFEGDILRNSLDSSTAIVKWGLPHTGFVLEMKGTVYAFAKMGSEIYEVIGNIYDNPELIGGTNNA